MEYIDLKKRFIEIYGGKEDDIRIFAAPGRVNMIGEHVDYNGGYVLPAALSMRTAIAVRKRDDKLIRLAATDLPDRVEAYTDRLTDYKSLSWGNYQLGVAWVMQNQGYEINGCDTLYDDTVPHGSGLSSSAAIEVATALMFAVFSNEKKGISKAVDMVEMALISQKAENEYIGVNCGIMDQFASANGKKNHVILLNCSNLEYKHIPLILGDYRMVIANTNKKRSLIVSKYNERREECENGLEILRSAIPSANNLSDITTEQFENFKGIIKDETILRRVRHVVTECNRVNQSVITLENGNIEQFGQLMNASHDSLKYDYEVTGAELDALVDEARKVKGCIGSRMTGAGFGGCTVSLVHKDSVDAFISSVSAAYLNLIGYEASFYVTVPDDGGREIK